MLYCRHLHCKTHKSQSNRLGLHEDSTEEDPIKYRYTWNQQMRERGTRGIRKLYTKLLRVSPNRIILQQQTVNLSKCKSKTTGLREFLRYVQCRDNMIATQNHYQQGNVADTTTESIA